MLRREKIMKKFKKIGKKRIERNRVRSKPKKKQRK